MTTQNRTAPDVAVPWCWTEKHEAWHRLVRSFADDDLARVAPDNYARRRFPAELVPRLAELGCFGILAPQKYGGAGGDLTSACIAFEELARVDVSTAVLVHVQVTNVALLAALGTPAQVGEVVRRAVQGESLICFCMSESAAGSDARGIQATATLTDEGWTLTGSKRLITNAGTPFSDYAIVWARTADAGSGPRATTLSAFLVPLSADGVTVGPAYEKIGWHASDTHPVSFDRVRIPHSAQLGDPNGAYRQAIRSLTWARMPMAAIAVGLAQGCLDATLELVETRGTSGQHTAFSCADLAAIAVAGRALVYDASWRFDHGHAFAREASIAKYVTTELANRAAHLASRIHGDHGVAEASVVARHFADARVLTIVEGTSEAQRTLIAKSLGFG